MDDKSLIYLRDLAGMRRLSIGPAATDPEPGMQSIPLRDGRMLAFDAEADLRKGFMAKALCETVLELTDRGDAGERAQATLMSELQRLVEFPDDLVAPERRYTELVDFLPPGCAHAVLQRDALVAGTGLVGALLDQARRQLADRDEFTLRLRAGNLWGCRVGDIALVALLQGPDTSLIRAIARLRLLWQQRVSGDQMRMRRDPLTGLANRFGLLADLAGQRDGLLALVNTRSFRLVNQLYGQVVGDRYLCAVADHLKYYQPPAGCYRVYADQFALLLPAAADASEREGQALLRHCKGLQLNVAAAIPNKVLRLALEVEIAIVPCSEPNPLEMAHHALRHARASRRSLVCHDADIAAKLTARLDWVQRIGEAIGTDGVVAVYQGWQRQGQGGLPVYEALMRLRIGEQLFAPQDFLEISRISGTYATLERMFIERVLREFAPRNEAVSINLGIADLLQDGLLDFMRRCSRRYGMPLHRVIIELVESDDLSAHALPVTHFIEAARAEGIRIAIDDFGSGNANFSLTDRIAPDIIKIDGPLISKLETPHGTGVVRAIVEYAKSMGALTVAEHVADVLRYDACLALGIDYCQGFFCGAPHLPGLGLASPALVQTR